MQDEQSLVQRARQGDKEAFTKLYESHFEKIYRYVAIKLGNRAEAEDMTQQVFIRAYESIGSYQHQGFPFSSWLFRIAHNQVVDYIRKEIKKPTVQLDESMPIVGDSDPVHDVEIKLSMEKVAEASLRLTKAQREVISLRFAGGLSIAEAAKTMKKSEGAIKALQFSAIQALRKTLAGESR
ncbi:MAG TPA: sigma-70 family RNA polymerase sigma factor [Dehalococcoidales bacterium]|nr:sigma-70 family RNA polymerase sigma factor [Dehalococcoidales bacterium]